MRRPIVFSIAIATVTFAMTSIAALAQPAPTISGFPWEGEVTGTNVYVRSGPGVNYYPTTKLNSGDRLLVLGEKFGWYQVVPPSQSFSYIDQTKIEKIAGTKNGRVTQDNIYVCAGSHLVKRKTSTQVILNKGAIVEISGQEDGFYRVEPPIGATLFMSKDYVNPVPERMQTGLLKRYEAKMNAAKSGETKPASAVPEAAAEALPQPIIDDPFALSAEEPLETERGENIPASGMDSDVVGSDSDAAPGVTAANRPSTAVAEGKPTKSGQTGRYEALLATVESDLRAMIALPMAEQDMGALIPRYEEIARQEEERVPSEIAKVRIDQLNNQISIRATKTRLVNMAEDLETYRSQMSAERMKIMRVHTEATLVKFDLEGELRKTYAFPSDLRRYRLVDPQRNTTVAYVDFTPDMDGMAQFLVGRQVGIRISGQEFSPTARVPVALVASVVDLTPRLDSEPPPQAPTAAPSQNIPVSDDNSIGAMPPIQKTAQSPESTE